MKDIDRYESEEITNFPDFIHEVTTIANLSRLVLLEDGKMQGLRGSSQHIELTTQAEVDSVADDVAVIVLVPSLLEKLTGNSNYAQSVYSKILSNDFDKRVSGNEIVIGHKNLDNDN